jgi:hemerythrin superfamily protein
MSPSDGTDAGGSETVQGRAMFEELLWVHSMIRRDLELVEKLAADVGEGLPGEAVREALGELKTNGPLWQLKVNCLRYCRFVHAHHGAEDRLLFPALRAADASIGPLVDRLEADHARVSDLLDAIEAAARALTEADGGAARPRVVDGLRDLHGHLLEHLDYEELHAGPPMRRLERLEVPRTHNHDDAHQREG